MKANVRQKNDRLIPVEIAGMPGYFNFSLAAAKEVLPRMTELEGLSDDPGAAEAVSAMGTISDAFSVLLNEGAKYINLLAEQTGTEPEKVIAPTPDELCTLMNLPEMSDLFPQFFAAVNAGSGRTVEVKPDPKNAKTAQKK